VSEGDSVIYSATARANLLKLGGNIAQTWTSSPYNGSDEPWQYPSNPFNKEHVEQILKHTGVPWSLES
jgi:hypothetical protein